MSFVTLDDDFPHHPKTVQAGNDAATLFVFGLCYCRKYHTGGFIPLNAVKSLGFTANPRKAIDALIAVGYWLKEDDGFRVHGYAYDDIRDKQRKDDRAEKRREAGRRGGLAKASNAASKPPSTSVATAQQTASKILPLNGIRDQGSGESLGEKGERREPLPRNDLDFLSFQAQYPAHRRKGGRLVEGYFVDAVIASGDVRVLFDALEKHKQSEQWSDPKHVPGMDTWLSMEIWRQVLPAAPAAGEWVPPANAMKAPKWAR
jgi:hypothetical protein